MLLINRYLDRQRVEADKEQGNISLRPWQDQRVGAMILEVRVTDSTHIDMMLEDI